MFCTHRPDDDDGNNDEDECHDNDSVDNKDDKGAINWQGPF